MSIVSRAVTKSRFTNGKRPPEEHFFNLVDSFAHLVEDGATIQELEEGTEAGNRVISPLSLASVYAKRSRLIQEIDAQLGNEDWKVQASAVGDMTKADYAPDDHPGEVKRANSLYVRPDGSSTGSNPSSLMLGGPGFTYWATGNSTEASPASPDLQMIFNWIQMNVNNTSINFRRDELQIGNSAKMVAEVLDRGTTFRKHRITLETSGGAEIVIDRRNVNEANEENRIDFKGTLYFDSVGQVSVPTPPNIVDGERVLAVDPQTGEVRPRIMTGSMGFGDFKKYASPADFQAEYDSGQIPNGTWVMVYQGGASSTFANRNAYAIAYIDAPPTGDFPINITAENGTVTKTPDAADYPTGRQVVLEAVPNTDFAFVEWGDGETVNPRTVTVNGTLNIEAIFASAILSSAFTPLASGLTVELRWDGSGTTSRAEIDWGDGSAIETIIDSSPMDPRPSYIYGSAGTYNIMLRLFDNNNNPQETYRQITIA